MRPVEKSLPLYCFAEIFFTRLARAQRAAKGRDGGRLNIAATPTRASPRHDDAEGMPGHAARIRRGICHVECVIGGAWVSVPAAPERICHPRRFHRIFRRRMPGALCRAAGYAGRARTTRRTNRHPDARKVRAHVMARVRRDTGRLGRAGSAARAPARRPGAVRRGPPYRPTGASGPTEPSGPSSCTGRTAPPGVRAAPRR